MDGNAAQQTDRAVPGPVGAPQGIRLPAASLPTAELHRVLYEFNNTKCAYPEHSLIQELFEARAAASEDAVALVCGDQQLSYSELNRKANQLAHALRAFGLPVEGRVALLVERGIESVVGMLGILKAGGVYVPLDPNYPADRLHFMIEDSAPVVIVAPADLERRARRLSMNVLVMDNRMSFLEDGNPTQDGLTSSSLAYVVYTSGSTGKPKGVMVEHRSILRLVVGSTYAPVNEQDCVSHTSSPSFDATTWEVWAALLNGARLLVIPQPILLEPVVLDALLVARRVTVMWLTIGLFNEYADLLQEAFSGLNYLLTGGDAMNPATARRVLQKSRPPRHLLNCYGPTETTTYASRLVVTAVAVDALSVPIGRPISNTTTYVLDENWQPAPVGTIGEIYIGGPGVARGYLERPDLTAERFVPDPFSRSSGYRLYRTGDLGRWRSDGSLDHLGRNDRQVKVRGFRVEPGEIEAVLQRVPWVRQAVVTTWEVKPDKRLVAYVVAHLHVKGTDKLTMRRHLTRQLRTYAQTVLPPYMVPAACVVLDSLPLTSNGKIDYKELPQPDLASVPESEYEAPGGDLEKTVADVWCDLLQVPRVSRHDNFFELGGHSLLMVRMMEQLRRVGVPGSTMALFAEPTLVGFCSLLVRPENPEEDLLPNRIPDNCAAIEPEMLTLIQLEPEEIQEIIEHVPGGARNVQDIYPLTPLQSGLLFHHLLSEQGPDVYVRPILLTVESSKSLERLITALQDVIDRHDVLRTAVFWEKLSQPAQVVYRKAMLPVHHPSPSAIADPDEQVAELLQLKNQKMDLQHAPLMSLHVVETGSGKPLPVVLKIHHSICDNVSLEAMFREVAAVIDGVAVESRTQTPFRNHVARMLALSRDTDVEKFFREKIGDVEEPTVPFGITDARGDGSSTEESSEEMERALGERARTVARLFGVSTASVFHAAWALVVSCTTGKGDVVFGSVLLGRMRSVGETHKSLGMFINTLPLRLRLECSVAGLVVQTQAELADLLRYEHASLSIAQRCSGIAGSASMFSSLLNYQHADPSGSSKKIGTDTGITVIKIPEWTNYPITLTVEEQDDRFTLRGGADRSIGAQRVIQFMKSAVSSLVEALETAPQLSATALQVLPEGERHWILDMFNATREEFSRTAVVHGLFEEQARRTPDVVAVICGSQQVTYSELDAKANRVASELMARGVRQGDRVAVFADRGVALVVGLLGTMKSGGAYVPIDVGYPAERVAYILTDCGPRAILTQESVLRQLPPGEVPILVFNGNAELLNRQAGDTVDGPTPRVVPSDLVYVIYTSGSTGRPKGAMLEHGNVVNLIAWNRKSFDLREGKRSSAVASVGFDASVFEMWPALCSGATLLLAPPVTANDPDALIDWWLSQDLDVGFLPTPLAEHAAARNAMHPTLRVMLVGGDRLRHHVVPDGVSLYNNYGPTETAVAATSGLMRAGEGVFHIGRPIANAQIYILDPYDKPVPIGVAGEIHIGGVCVGRGYLNQDEMTRAKFVGNPFARDPAERMYRSGDLGRWRADGTIEYLGRNDDQIKIRGFRIELGEIEVQLVRHPAVGEAIVITREDVPGSKHLVAYITERSGATLVTDELRSYLKDILPDYMIPNALVVVAEFPLTRNGKVDRKALPAPQRQAYSSGTYEAPQGPVEEVLASIWRDLLKVEVVGRDDDFFDLGGHSLLATQLKVRISLALSVELPVSDFFEYPILRELAARIDELRFARVMEKVTAGGDEMEDLLRKVASMPDGKVREWLRELNINNGVEK